MSINGEIEMPNVKSFDVFGNEDDPDITHVQFFAGEMAIQIDLTKEQRTELGTLLNTSVE